MNARSEKSGWAAERIARGATVVVLLLALAAGLSPGWGAGRVQASGFAAGDRVVVDDGPLNLRTGAGVSYSVIDVLVEGTGLTIAAGPKTAGGYHWYKVRTDSGTTGWVAGEFLSYVGWSPDFEVGDFAVVDTSRLNCRSGPGLDAEVVYVMDDGTEVEILDGPVAANGYHWFKVETDDGDIGWVIGEGLAATDDGGSAIGKGDEVVVATDRLNLRVGAGLDKTVVDVLPLGTALIVSNGPMAADGYDWFEVETLDGGLGWVAGVYLAPRTEGSFVAGDEVHVTGGRLNLRAEPGLSAKVLRLMADNTELLILGGPVEADGYSWYRVEDHRGEGWAAGEFLRIDQ